MKIKIKDQIPDTDIFHLVDTEPKQSKLREILGIGKIILFGLPGAFTSTCSKLHLPGFVANADKIKKKGIKMLSDPYLLFTKAIGAEVDRNSKGMGIRSNRYAMVIENLEVLNIQVEKETKQCGLTSAESILKTL